MIYLTNEQNLIGYGRFDDKDKVFVLVYTGSEPRQVRVPVWRLEVKDGEFMASMLYSDQDGFDVKARIYEVKEGYVTVELGAESSIIVKSVEKAY